MSWEYSHGLYTYSTYLLDVHESKVVGKSRSQVPKILLGLLKKVVRESNLANQVQENGLVVKPDTEKERVAIRLNLKCDMKIETTFL